MNFQVKHWALEFNKLILATVKFNTLMYSENIEDSSLVS